jgi:membrane protease YdiL (CAAX protease family)
LNFRPASLIFKTAAGLVYGGLYLRHRALISPAVAHTLSWFIVGAL